jgi:hypothetical protein
MRKDTKWLLVGLVLGAVVGACTGDSLVAPTIASSDSRLKIDSALTTLLAQARIDVNLANLNTCDAGLAVKTTAGKLARFDSKRQKIDVKYGPGDTSLAFARVMRFDPSGFEVEDAQCVVRAGNAAKEFLRSYFTSRGMGTKTSGIGMLSSIIDEGTECYYINDWGDVDCGGTTCYIHQTLRVSIDQGAPASNTIIRYNGR